MKKLVTLLLSLALVLSLAACGGEATPDASDDAPASSQNEESTENDNTENQIVFEEVVAIDNAECAVKITEIDPDNMWGYTLKAQLENKSTEKTFMFSVESASINGVQCDPMFASEVAAGKKANEESNFSTDTLEENGIVEYTDNHSQKLLSFRYNIDTNRVEARFTDGSAVANRMPNCLRTSSTRYFTVGLTRRIECHRFFMATAENHCNVFCVTNWSSE